MNGILQNHAKSFSIKLDIDLENPYLMIILPNSWPLKYPSRFKINLKVLMEVKIHLSILLRTEIWTCSITGCTTTDWFKLVKLVSHKKETLGTISINRINFTYSSSRNIHKWFRFILWFPKSLFFRVDQSEPVGSGTTSYRTGPNFCPQQDGKVNFHLQLKF